MSEPSVLKDRIVLFKQVATIVLIFGALLSILLFMGEASWKIKLDPWYLWIVSPYILFLFWKELFPVKRLLTSFSWMTSAFLMVVFSNYLYLDATFLNPHHTSTYIFIFLPGVMIVCGPLCCLLIYVSGFIVQFFTDMVRIIKKEKGRQVDS